MYRPEGLFLSSPIKVDGKEMGCEIMLSTRLVHHPTLGLPPTCSPLKSCIENSNGYSIHLQIVLVMLVMELRFILEVQK